MFSMKNIFCSFVGYFTFILATWVVRGADVVLDCYRTIPERYDGHQQTTMDGTPCIRWDLFSKTYKKEQFPDATLSNAANFCRAVGKDYLWCHTSWSLSSMEKCGIEKCDNDSLNECGNLKIEKPSLLGRNITFTFTPDSHSPNAILEWQRSNKYNPWYTCPLTYKFTQYFDNGSYYMILTDSVFRNDDVYYRIHYYNKSMHCWMETRRLELEDNPNNACGFVYTRPFRLFKGEGIFLEYFPSKYVIENPRKFKRRWIRTLKGKTSSVNLGGLFYKENKKENGNYELIIYWYIPFGGHFGVECGGKAGFSNNVSVIVQAEPSKPAFIGLQDIDDCHECIVGPEGDDIDIHCKTNGGTPYVTVTIKVGNESLNTFQNDTDTSDYIAITKLADHHHNSTIYCLVMNEALISPLIATAIIYVIQPSTSVVLSAPSELKEGGNAHITCFVPSSRPLPMVYLDISSKNMSSAEVITTFNKVNSMYTYTFSVTSLNREWNGKNISCCLYSKWYKTSTKCSEPNQINLLFTPSDIELEIIYVQVKPLQMYALCTLQNSNPACMVNISAAKGIIGSERTSISRNISLPNGTWKSEYAVNLNVSKEDIGEDVTCAARCQDFPDLQLRDTSFIRHPCNVDGGEKGDAKTLSGKDGVGAMVGAVFAALVVGVIIGVTCTCFILIRKGMFRGSDERVQSPSIVLQQIELPGQPATLGTYEQLQNRIESREAYDTLDANPSTEQNSQPQYEIVGQGAEASLPNTDVEHT